jgi:hypothetical protein
VFDIHRTTACYSLWGMVVTNLTEETTNAGADSPDP